MVLNQPLVVCKSAIGKACFFLSPVQSDPGFVPVCITENKTKQKSFVNRGHLSLGVFCWASHAALLFLKPAW